MEQADSYDQTGGAANVQKMWIYYTFLQYIVCDNATACKTLVEKIFSVTLTNPEMITTTELRKDEKTDTWTIPRDI